MLTKLSFSWAEDIALKQSSQPRGRFPILWLQKAFSIWVNCRRQFWPKAHQREVAGRGCGGGGRIFQLAWPHYNVNNTLLTIVLQERTCKWARNIQEAKEKNKTLPLLKAQTHSSARAGHTVRRIPRYEWAKRGGNGRGRKEQHDKAGVLLSTKAGFFLGFIKKLFKKRKYWGSHLFLSLDLFIQSQRTCDTRKWQHNVILVADVPLGIHQISSCLSGSSVTSCCVNLRRLFNFSAPQQEPHLIFTVVSSAPETALN